MRGIKGLRVLVTTCDKHLWLLPAFAYLFNKYWSPKQEVVVGCFAKPEDKLPDNFIIHQIQEDNIPIEQRSDGLIKFFKQLDDQYFVWMLEDFWLCDYVDVEGIELLFEWMKTRPDVLRVDLTVDRYVASKRGAFQEAGHLGHLDLILSNHGNRYLWSHQGALWNKRVMLPFMRPGEGIKHKAIEIMCTQRLNLTPNPPKVFGTKNWPLKYAHVIRKQLINPGCILLQGKPPVPVEDIAELRERGLIGVDLGKFHGIKRRGWK